MQALRPSSGWCTGVHLAVWGTVDADKHVDMTLAIPADTLRRVGLTRLPASTVLPIQVKGTIKRPDVDWLRYDWNKYQADLCQVNKHLILQLLFIWSPLHLFPTEVCSRMKPGHSTSNGKDVATGS
jgi:hypothetical protein